MTVVYCLLILHYFFIILDKITGQFFKLVAAGKEDKGAAAERGEAEVHQHGAVHQDEGDDPGAGPGETRSCRTVRLTKRSQIRVRSFYNFGFNERLCVSQRTERIHQQFRDDVVKRVRAELLQDHSAQVEQLTAQHQQEMQQLQ